MPSRSGANTPSRTNSTNRVKIEVAIASIGPITASAPAASSASTRAVSGFGSAGSAPTVSQQFADLGGDRCEWTERRGETGRDDGHLGAVGCGRRRDDRRRRGDHRDDTVDVAEHERERCRGRRRGEHRGQSRDEDTVGGMGRQRCRQRPVSTVEINRQVPARRCCCTVLPAVASARGRVCQAFPHDLRSVAFASVSRRRPRRYLLG